jgi:uncharacterized protein YbbK (DUF523 family)
MSDVPPLRPIRIGISACLLGEKVRFDGGHKQDPFLTGTFGRFVEWVPVCPEVEAGLGTPRESMRLVRTQDGVRLLTVKTARDLTATLDDYAKRRVEDLVAEELCGYVLKRDSPSCGLERVKVYGSHSVPRNPDADDSQPRCSSAFLIYHSRRKGACRIHGFGRTSSSGCSHTGDCARSSAADGA